MVTGFAESKEIMPYESVHKVVSDYNEAVKRISAGYELLYQAQKLAGNTAKYFYVLWDGYGRSGNSIDEETSQRVINSLKAKTWAGILEKTQARKFMTNRRYMEFEKALEKPEELPPINIETVQDFVQNLVDSAPDMLLEFVKETFNWLKPGKWAVKAYKTNAKSEYELQEKIIKSHVFDAWYSPPRLGYHSQQPMIAMDNAFHLLDGKGTAKNGSAAVTAIEEARLKGMQIAETDYFKFKWFKNGNCHIQFKRMDLVNKMNQVAGENILRP